ncbi:urate hydroxylase PuuD [bacterium]|nr:urate hydroxylase PuuD [bacterium]
MQLALLSTDGFLFLLRWFHFFFGVIWIGLLYYFNFVQGAFFAETDAATKSAATQKLVPRALWWFRWGAMYTFLTGFIILMARGHQGGFGIFGTSWGFAILTGAALGTLMFLNVWLVIWPNQKVVIQSATQAASGGQAIPDAATRGARAGVASRTNVLFSIPMLFFMGAANHLPFAMSENPKTSLYMLAVALIIGGAEYNALKGKTGPLTTIKGVITCGFALTAVFYILMEALL